MNEDFNAAEFEERRAKIRNNIPIKPAERSYKEQFNAMADSEGRFEKMRKGKKEKVEKAKKSPFIQRLLQAKGNKAVVKSTRSTYRVSVPDTSVKSLTSKASSDRSRFFNREFERERRRMFI